MTIIAKTLLSSVAAKYEAAASALSISANYKAAVLLLKTELGNFIKVLSKADAVGFADAGVKEIRKVSQDAYKVFGEHALELSKQSVDQITVTEVAHVTAIKVVSDLSTMLDAYNTELTKLIPDQLFQLNEAVAGFLNKAVNHVCSAVDRLDSKTFSKSASDTPIIGDQVVVSLSREHFDASNFLDQRYTYIAKVISDTINVTDDLDGAASIDDDQEVQFFKVINELATTQDELYRLVYFLRSFMEVAGVSDKVEVSTEKPFTDIPIETSDAYSFETNKIIHTDSELSDSAYFSQLKDVIDSSEATDQSIVWVEKASVESVEMSEVFTLEATKPVDDSHIVADVPTVHLSKYFSESFSAADFLDLVTIIFERAYQESTTTSDFTSLQNTKSVSSEACHTVDSVSLYNNKNLPELAFLADLVYRLTNKELIDSTAVSEFFSFSAVKASNDGFSLTDSGGLRSQSYCDFTYMAEDYVGVSRTF